MVWGCRHWAKKYRDYSRKRKLPGLHYEIHIEVATFAVCRPLAQEKNAGIEHEISVLGRTAPIIGWFSAT